MFSCGREKKHKSAKPKHSQQEVLTAATEPPRTAPKASKRAIRRKAKLNHHVSDDDLFSEEPDEATSGVSKQRSRAGAVHPGSLADSVFMNWEQLLGSRETLKCRLNSIAAVHGWEARSSQNIFLGGIEPHPLLQSIHTEIASLDPASEKLGQADLLLELQKKREQFETLSMERDRLAEDMAQLWEENFEARDLLASQSDELDRLRQQELEQRRQEGQVDGMGSNRSSIGADGQSPALQPSQQGQTAASAEMATFNIKLSRAQLSEGRRVVEALERLKIPDEASMGPRELACWHENKKTIVNSLRTLSSQIYSTKTRILFEIIQNADDCSFDSDGELRELYLECSEEALVAYHNEKGFQPADLYAMCQVGESNKLAGSGKIGRKGIGFKSVFQISDRPVVISPPFQFCFDTISRGIFGYIVPSWVDSPHDFVPPRHLALLNRLYANDRSDDDGPGVSSNGTLLVCPLAARTQSLDIMRDLNFDGLALAFLKNLEKITFVSSAQAPVSSARADLEASEEGLRASGVSGCSVPKSLQEYRVQRTVVFEHAHDGKTAENCMDVVDGGLGGAILKGIQVVSHQLFQCTIIERVESAAGNAVETRRHYRLHNYTTLKYKSGAAVSAAFSALPTAPATTTISLAFPVNEDLTPQRSADGELIFAYLPVTSAGFGFAINADFELVASRQDVSDNHSGNHMLLGRIPRLFVHAVLTDPALGEDAFPVYLPDVEALRKDRSGSGRKWYMLASALHRETSAFMMIPTEDEPERVRRRHAVLRPKHLSRELVPNSLLKAVTAGNKHFAQPDAVKEMCLENCLEECPVSIVLDCIRVVLDRIATSEGGTNQGDSKGGTMEGEEIADGGGGADGDGDDGGHGSKKRGKKVRKKLKNPNATPIASSDPCICKDVLLDVWRYCAAAYASCVQQGDQGEISLRQIVDALVGGVSSARSSTPPFRIFPVRGSTKLRLNCEHGVPLCLGISPSLVDQGPSVVRLAQRLVPFLDMDRLQDVEGIEDIMRFLRVCDATHIELEQQIENSFRFGFSATADPQLWWDSFRYTVSLGHARGLVGFMPGTAIALPVTDNRVVSSRDVFRLSVSLPCLLGLCRHSGSKHTLVVPPSAAKTWRERIRWELAMVQVFGATFPKAAAERIPLGAFASDLLFAIAHARDEADTGTLEALEKLLDLYENFMGSLLPRLRAAMGTSRRPEECLLEQRSCFHPFPSSCSPKYIDEMLEFARITLADTSFHDTRNLLEKSFGMLRLRDVVVGEGAKSVAHVDELPEEIQGDEGHGVEDDEHDDESSVGSDDCDEAVWNVLERLLGFRHSFDASHCTWILYSVLTPVLLSTRADSGCDGGDGEFFDADDVSEHSQNPHTFDSDDKNKRLNKMQCVLNSMASRVAPFLDKVARVAILSLTPHTARSIWSLISGIGGLWLGSDFVSLERCIWKIGDGDIWANLQRVGCDSGPIVAIESALNGLLQDEEEDGEVDRTALSVIGNCCLKGLLDRQGGEGNGSSPALPYPTDLDMMLGSVLPWLLERDGVDRRGRRNDDHAVAQGVADHQWSNEIISCYTAVLASMTSGGFPRSKRWEVPVPSATLGLTKIAVDHGFNRLMAKEATNLIVLPDQLRWPLATAFVLHHFGDHCLHPTIAPLFATIAERQSVSIEGPRDRIQRTFQRCLRLAASDADAAAAASESGNSDMMWALISELYERPVEASLTSSSGSALPFSDGDNWELLLWAVITCATDWYRMQSTGDQHDASNYQATLDRVRRLVPFIEALPDGGGERWTFLAGRRRETVGGNEMFPPPSALADGQRENASATSGASGTAVVPDPTVLLLRTLFGFDLWGNLDGLELRGRAPTTTASIPPRLLRPCTAALSSEVRHADASTSSSVATSQQLRTCFPEYFDRMSLVLIWEWFLLEVAGAAPPAVLWATIQEPVIARARPRIRAAVASFRQAHLGEEANRSSIVGDVVRGTASTSSKERLDDNYNVKSLEAALLDAVDGHTQVDRLFSEMDAVDEARRLAEQEAAEARRIEREAAEARRREEEQARRRMEADARQQERFERERERQRERERGQERDALRRQRERMQEQQDEIDRMRRAQAELSTADPSSASSVASAFGSIGISNALRRMLEGGGNSGGGDGVVRRHVPAPTMRESEVKGKLARFLAGMRAFERQQAAACTDGGTSSSGGGRSTKGGGGQQMPPVLAEFIVWAGDMLAGDGGNTRTGGRVDRLDGARLEQAARRYVGGSGAARGATGANRSSASDHEEERCSICHEELTDTTVFDELGEPLETGCGHRFHAVCFARHLEVSEQDPWCPMCRSSNLSVRFLGVQHGRGPRS